MSDNVNKSWLSSLGTVVAVLTVVLNGMGFLTIRTFIIRMCLPTNFFEDTPIDYFQWGAKALVELMVITIIAAICISLLVAILSFILRQTVLRVHFVKDSLEALVHRAHARVQLMSATRLIAILFIFSFVIFLVYCSTQNHIITEFAKNGCDSGHFDVPAVFSSLNAQSSQNYQFFSAFLIIILCFALFLSNKTLMRSGGKRIFPNLFTFAIFSLLIFAVAFWAMPYRLMSHNEFEAVRYSNEKAFIISEKDSRLFLYVPGQRPFVIEKNDTLLGRTGKHYYENVFDN